MLDLKFVAGRGRTALIAIAFSPLLVAGPALAIPSPELIVGSATSLSQLVALVAASLGGGAMMISSRSGSRTSSPVVRRLALGLGVVAAASLLLNIYQLVDGQRETRARLEATLVRPTAKTSDGATLDPLLREIPYKTQLTHPLGLDTADAEALVRDIADGRRSDWRIVDIRETAETEAGTLPTAATVRFPDLPASDLDLANTKSLFICHNGNRSAETCAALAAKGHDCRFIRGGLEKWLSERRFGFGVRNLADLRAIPDYRGRDVLLDTEAVKRLVTEENAIFVDVRYPGEFNAGHLPNAINLPLRSMPTTEVALRLTGLRKGPVIVPCYDRRSCFFGEILGLLLARAGGDFRGRYTVPWEYFVASPPPPHVEQALAAQNRSYLEQAGAAAAAGLGHLSGRTGLVAAILIVALLSRLAVLPFSLKAERDQAAARRIEPEVTALKQRLSDDPVRLRRAMLALYRREKLTPLRNLLALLLLPLMAVLSVAVQTEAELRPTSLAWLPSLAERDPLLLLPALGSALLILYVQQAFDLTGRRRIWLWALSLPLLTSSLAMLGAGVALYIAFSAGLLLVQRVIVSGAAARRLAALASWPRRTAEARAAAAGIIPLSAAPMHLANCGNKALRLAELKADGIVVPDGVVLTGACLERLWAMTDAERARTLNRIWRRIGAAKLAVRSSAEAEDGHDHSFAGVFESVLDVERAGLEDAIRRVHASFTSDRVKAYGIDGGAGNVLLQRMIEPRFAGVLFTRDPAAAGYIMVEMVEGCGEALVSGAATPKTFRFSRHADGAPMADTAAPTIDVAPLLAIGHRAEQLFSAAQDIEWAFANDRFYVVQSRDIVGASHDSPPRILQDEWARVLATVDDDASGEVVFAQNEMTEMLPRPTPMSLALMAEFWSAGGSLDLACRRLGLSYTVDEDSPPYVTSVMGRLYVDQRQARKRGPAIGALDARRLRKCAASVANGFNDDFLAAYLADITLAEVADYDRLPLDRLLAELARRRRSFVEGTHAEVDVINILAQFYVQDASRALRDAGLDPLVHLAPGEASEPQRILQRASKARGAERDALLLEGFGHRAVLDYELATPRFADDRQGLAALLPAMLPSKAADASAEGMAAHIPAIPPALQAAVDRARQYQILKETAKHHSLRELAELRRLVLAVDRRLGLDGDVFQLTFDELEASDTREAGDFRRLASERRRRAEVMASAPALPAALTVEDIRAASAGLRAKAMPDGAIVGTRVAGSKPVLGRAIVVTGADAEQGATIDGFMDGDIIVARMIHPAWIVYFPRAGGLVSELGGWLSHTALLAREYDLAMIVGVRGIDAIADGEPVELQLDGAVCVRRTPTALAAE